MATLVLGSAPQSEETDRHSIALRHWLREGWAVVFSHPEDFIRCDLEMDRWLGLIQRAFTTARIRPLALARSAAEVVGSWIAQVSEDTRRVLLAPLAHPQGRTFDLRAAALRAHIDALGTRRFVMVVDDAAEIRRTYTYPTFADVPSPLEFLGWADAARTRGGERDGAAAALRAHWSARWR